MTRRSRWIAMLALAGTLAAQPTAVTLGQAVESALKRYPSIQVSREEMARAAAAIQLARTAYLPRVEALAQANRATRNNVFGMLLPQSVIPPISGPVLGSNNLGTAWGSALGALVTWEPFDFGLRRANTAIAGAERAQSEAALRRTQFDVAVAAADAYLTLVAAGETVAAAKAGVDRAEVVVRTTAARVDAQLRPGADQSRAEAELAAARTQWIQAQQAAEIARATLAQFTGNDPSQLSVATGGLLGPAPEQTPPPLDTAANPVLGEQNATIETARAHLRALERSFFPRFYLQGSAYARGTGAEMGGGRLGGVNGLAPDVQNYALGFSVSFPLSDLPALHAREAAQSATVRAEAARAETIAVEIRAQWNRAVAALGGARRIAANTPVQVSAARAAATQAAARYQSGLGIIDEVASAERLLTQAEIDDAIARLNVWRGLLGIAAAAGNIEPFLVEANR